MQGTHARWVSVFVCSCVVVVFVCVWLRSCVCGCVCVVFVCK